MMMQVIYEKPQVKLFHDEERQLVRITWYGKIPLEVYQEALGF